MSKVFVGGTKVLELDPETEASLVSLLGEALSSAGALEPEDGENLRAEVQVMLGKIKHARVIASHRGRGGLL